MAEYALIDFSCPKFPQVLIDFDVLFATKYGSIYLIIVSIFMHNINDGNSFLSTFTEGNNGVSGIIFGSNVTGTSDLKFEKVNGTYNGGFKDFNNVNRDAASNVKLNGNSYYADDWPVDGTLDTQQKILHAYHQKLQYLKM